MTKRRILASVLCLLALLLCACAKDSGRDAAAPEPSASAEPVPTAAPSPRPTLEPLIRDEWYSVRNENISSWLRTYASLPEDEIGERLDRMLIDPDKKMVAFTFDDGPNPTYTPLILDILEQYDARATFFIVGSHIEGNEALLERMLCLGCEIGTHTWNHTKLSTCGSKAEMEEAILSVNRKIMDLLDYRIVLFRPPYIDYKKGDTKENLISIMKENGMAVINHSRSTHDTHDDYDAEMIYKRGVEPVDELNHGLDNAIILCHDKSRKTVDAFRRIVPELQSQGYQFVTVSELLLCSEEGFHPGWIYSKAD